MPVRYGAGGLRGDGFHALGSGGRHIGGEDTFICITKNEEQAVSLTGELKSC